MLSEDAPRRACVSSSVCENRQVDRTVFGSECIDSFICMRATGVSTLSCIFLWENAGQRGFRLAHWRLPSLLVAVILLGE